MDTINLVMHIMVPILTLVAGMFIGVPIGVYIVAPIFLSKERKHDKVLLR